MWTLWDAGILAGCGALKALDAQHAEIKSMRTASSHRRKGVAKQLLQHLLAEAKRRGYTRVSLETGSMDFFSRRVPCMPVLGLPIVPHLPTTVQTPIASL
jgi:putative acetyltransferase